MQNTTIALVKGDILNDFNKAEGIDAKKELIEKLASGGWDKYYADAEELIESKIKTVIPELEVPKMMKNQHLASIVSILDNKFSLAENELKDANLQLKLLENSLLKQLIPKDLNDQKNSILEIRAGTGGDEASLFAADLFSMYKKYSALNNWKCEILSISETSLRRVLTFSKISLFCINSLTVFNLILIELILVNGL